jgi:hypothetical protein
LPPEYLNLFLNGDDSLPDPDAVLGLEEESGEAPSKPPPVAELLKDPDVAAVVEAADGLKPVPA